MTDRPPRDIEGSFDIGHGHYLRPFEDDLLWSHPECRGWHQVDVSTGKRHIIIAGGLDDLEHLTIEGSLLCYEFQTHGFIREGRWMPA